MDRTGHPPSPGRPLNRNGGRGSDLLTEPGLVSSVREKAGFHGASEPPCHHHLGSRRPRRRCAPTAPSTAVRPRAARPMGCGSGKAVVSKSTLQATVKSVTSPEDRPNRGTPVANQHGRTRPEVGCAKEVVGRSRSFST